LGVLYIIVISALFPFLLLIQGVENNFFNMFALPLLILFVCVPFAVVALRLYSHGEGAEAGVRERYAASRKARSEHPPMAPINAAINSFQTVSQFAAESGVRIFEGHRNLTKIHRRHVRWVLILATIMVTPFFVLWLEWGWRGIVGLAPKIDQSATFTPRPPLNGRPASIPGKSN